MRDNFFSERALTVNMTQLLAVASSTIPFTRGFTLRLYYHPHPSMAHEFDLLSRPRLSMSLARDLSSGTTKLNMQL